MEQISKIKKCYSCGVTLQSEDPNAEGYIHPEILENPNQNFLFCNKCFEIERFRSTSNEPMIDDDLIKVITEAKEKDCLLVYVVNLLSFETSFSKEIVDLVKGMKIAVVATKYDLLPTNTSRDAITEYVAHRLRVAGIHVTSDDVVIFSDKDDDTARDVLTKIFELKNNKNVYVIGSTLAGKTAVINSILRVYSNFSNGTISTHIYKDTNLKVMEIPMTNKTSLYETPGISITNSILFNLDSKTLRSIYITKPLEARFVNITKGHSLFIGGLAVIELVEGPKTEFVTYVHPNIQLRKNHIRNVEEKFVYLNKKGLLTPSYTKINSTKDFEIFEIQMQEGDGRYRDIGFAGLGWVSLKSMNQKLRIYIPKGVSLYTSRPKIEVK